MRVMLHPVCLLVLLFTGGSRNGLAEGPLVGDRAPRLEIAEWLSGDMRSAGALAGKTIVLEFWATWCGPCRAMIPRMNDLVAKLATNEVVFISISDEERERVISFMQKVPMKVRIVLDSNHQTYQSYGIRSIPYMYIIDGTGTVKWRGHPGTLQDSTLSRLLGSEPGPVTEAVPAVSPPPPATPLSPASSPSTNISLVVKNSAPGTGQSRSVSDASGQIEIRITGQPAAHIIGWLLHYPATQVRVRGPSQTLPQDVLCFAPSSMGLSEAQKQAAQTLCGSLGLTVSRVSERSACRVMKSTGTRRLPPHSVTMRVVTTGGMWKATAASANDLAGFLGNHFGVLTVDETHLAGAYDFDIPSEDYVEARKTLESRYGIRIDEGIRTVEFLVLTAGR